MRVGKADVDSAHQWRAGRNVMRRSRSALPAMPRHGEALHAVVVGTSVQIPGRCIAFHRPATIVPLESPTYIVMDSTICLQLLIHWMSLALVFARASAGSNNAARIAIMAITTSSSIKVNAATRSPLALTTDPKVSASNLLQYCLVRCLMVFLWSTGLSGLLCFAATPAQFTADGTPTGLEEEIRWRLNRGRFDSISENQTRGTAYTDVPASSGPLAPNQCLSLAARHQSEDMAKLNLFQHETVPGSAYYNPASQPKPWDRMHAEGYSWNYAGENIAAGYSGAEAAYVCWWNSTGHRQNMYNGAYREIGDGYFYWSSSTYRSYFTMDLGNSGSTCFVTDTLFYDANTNGLYDQAEGISGVSITLLVGGVTHSYFDLSSTVGSFAIPIESIATAASVQVVLSNTTIASVTLNIPRDYRNYSAVALAPGQCRVLGTFTRPSGARNVGLRDLTPASLPIAAPRLALAVFSTNTVLTWPSEINLQYLPQRTTNFLFWSNLTAGYLVGTGSNMTWLDLASGSGNRNFYRLLIRQ
jgi:hypothetical protein